MKDMKRAVEAGEQLPNPIPADFNYLGGKPDDITITLAQVFHTQNGERKGYADKDTFYKDKKTIYTGAVPVVSYDQLKRARFHKREEQYPPTADNEEL